MSAQAQVDAVLAWCDRQDVYSKGESPTTAAIRKVISEHGEVDDPVAAAIDAVADEWQWKAWASAPRLRSRVEERLATAQYVTDWLREKARKVRDGG